MKERCDAIKGCVNEQEGFVGGSSKHFWECDKLPNSCQRSLSNPCWAFGFMGRRNLSLFYSVGIHSSFLCIQKGMRY